MPKRSLCSSTSAVRRAEIWACVLSRSRSWLGFARPSWRTAPGDPRSPRPPAAARGAAGPGCSSPRAAWRPRGRSARSARDATPETARSLATSPRAIRRRRLPEPRRTCRRRARTSRTRGGRDASTAAYTLAGSLASAGARSISSFSRSMLLEGRTKQPRFLKPYRTRVSTTLEPIKPFDPVTRIRSCGERKSWGIVGTSVIRGLSYHTSAWDLLSYSFEPPLSRGCG